MSRSGLQVSIRELRKAHGLTLAGLAARITEHGVEVHPATLGNIELGQRRPSDELRAAWARALDVSPLDVWQPPHDMAS